MTDPRPARGVNGDRPRTAGQADARSPETADRRPVDGLAERRVLPALTGDEVRRLVYEHYHRRIMPRRDRLD
jgi:hypothetical protein